MTEPKTTPETIIVSSETDNAHVVGNADCQVGWCSGVGWDYPHPCEEPGCPGQVHAEFGDESYEGDYWLYTKCDVCEEPD